MGVGDDPAVRRLPEHFREAHCRDTALDQVMKHCARSNGWKLVYVADQNESGAVRNRPNKGVHQRYEESRGSFLTSLYFLRFLPIFFPGSKCYTFTPPFKTESTNVQIIFAPLPAPSACALHLHQRFC
jgi:hypothetical protein